MFFKKRADSPGTTIIGQAHAVAPGGKFDGNDGKWSSFLINIGDDETGHGQNFRVLPSTSSPLTIVPRAATWCSTAECAQRRGIEIFNSKQPLGFEASSSKAWQENGRYGIPVPNWWSGTKSLDATWGSDNVGLGPSSAQSFMLASQWVVQSDIQDFFMGSFGLAAGAVDPGSGPKQPFLTNFAIFNVTPSVSYGYTAGAYYRNNGNGVLGNLILGGFDQSRFDNRGISIPMPSTLNTSLVVGVQSIIHHATSDDSLTAGSPGFSATIDSTLPYLYLPDAICDRFASKFGLKWDNRTQLYTVDDANHKNNQASGATVTFKIGAGPDDSNLFTTITLPYAAFDHQFTFSNSTTTNYFPIRRSKTGVFVLGRAFLQEAYIVVDYERANFTVAPALPLDTLPDPHIVPIYKKGFIPPNADPTSTPSGQPGGSGGKGGLAAGAIAGIVIGVIFLFLLGVGGFLFWKRWRKPKKHLDEKPEIAEIDTMYVAEIKHMGTMELDSTQQAQGYYGNDRDNKDVPFPAEMESPPAAPVEMYSPPVSNTPAESDGKADYFARPRRRGATRESSTSNTPGTPGVADIHELPGDDGQYQVGGIHFERVESPTPSVPLHSRGPSDTNIDQVISDKPLPTPTEASSPTEKSPTVERRPSHARGASDTTVQSDVSQPTPEEMEKWALGGNDPRRPISEEVEEGKM